MYLLRLLIRTFSVLLFAAFGTFAAPGDWARVSYHVEAQELSVQPVNLAYTARAPPTIGANLTTTGTAFTQTGNLRASDGAGTTGAGHDGVVCIRSQ